MTIVYTGGQKRIFKNLNKWFASCKMGVCVISSYQLETYVFKTKSISVFWYVFFSSSSSSSSSSTSSSSTSSYYYYYYYFSCSFSSSSSPFSSCSSFPSSSSYYYYYYYYFVTFCYSFSPSSFISSTSSSSPYQEEKNIIFFRKSDIVTKIGTARFLLMITTKIDLLFITRGHWFIKTTWAHEVRCQFSWQVYKSVIREQSPFWPWFEYPNINMRSITSMSFGRLLILLYLRGYTLVPSKSEDLQGGSLRFFLRLVRKRKRRKLLEIQLEFLRKKPYWSNNEC